MVSTFQSNDTSISEILKDIDRGANQLPDFQRGWVWDDERIRSLIASISNAYPVGALMFLEYGGDTVRFKYRPFTGSTADCKPDILVLDGQQRLTSVYGAMYSQKPVPTQTTKKEAIERFYYLDIDKCLANDVTGVIDWLDGQSEPDTIARAYSQPTRLLSMQTRNSAAYKGVMALILKAGALDFISGKAMDFTVFSDENIDIHHIFPQSYCKERYKKEKWNSIVNKTPLSYRTNRIIGGNAPSTYLKKIEQDGHVTEDDLNQYLATHHIDVDDIRADRFDEYFIKRAKVLLELIGAAMGKPVMNLGGEDVISAFGGSLE